jgi:tagatose 1,6-diphosphate aldolase GatY/KbaY
VIAHFQEIIAEHRQTRSAVGAFTCYEATTAMGVVQAAEAVSTPVILLVSLTSFSGAAGDLLVSALLAIAEKASVPVCVQLDHVDDLALIERAIEVGIGAVMADGSRLSFSQNAELVDRAVRTAHAAGAGVEAELGHIEGGEDIAAATRSGSLTEPAEAQRLVEACAIDCLAVSIGNVHGLYASEPVLDWPRLAKIRNGVDVPLSLHGASGLPRTDIRTAIESGIAKVNINLELRRRAFAELEHHLPALRSGYQMLELQRILRDSAAEVVAGTLAVLGPPT